MSADMFAAILLAFIVGATSSHFLTWRFARKVEDLGGGLRRWDDYEAQNAQAKGQGVRQFPARESSR